MFDPSQTGRYRFDATQPPSRCSVTNADEVVSQSLDDWDDLALLARSLVFGDQDGLLCFDEDTAVRLISPTPR